MLPGPAAERALGYLALVLLVWSPLLWSAGPMLLRPPKAPGGAGHLSGSESDGEEAALALPRRSPLASSPAATLVALRSFARKVATPPFLAVVAGAAAGMTPLGERGFRWAAWPMAHALTGCAWESCPARLMMHVCHRFDSVQAACWWRPAVPPLLPCWARWAQVGGWGAVDGLRTRLPAFPAPAAAAARGA